MPSFVRRAELGNSSSVQFMKYQVLTRIYSVFDHWLSQWNFVCYKGCSTCCTQNVTMTGLEGEHIYRFIKDRQKEEWFVNVLQSIDLVENPGPTTNEFATFCLNDEEIESPHQSHSKPCPFLIKQSCTIYEARPFNCRCFVSREKCRSDRPAVVPDFILTGSTVVMQIVEHLDQRGQWGNMLDILRIQSVSLQSNDLIQRRIHECKPLPGFLIPPEDFKHVQSLLDSIFSAQVDGKSVKMILNGG